MYVFGFSCKKCLYINAKTPMHHGGVGAQVGAWRLVLCCHVLFQKVLLRANVCRHGSESGGHSTCSRQDGEEESPSWGQSWRPVADLCIRLMLARVAWDGAWPRRGMGEEK